MAAAQAAPDVERGKALLLDRQKSLCILCHSAPIGEARHQGNLAPNLAGIGSRLTYAELIERISDARQKNPDTIMPVYQANSQTAAPVLHRVTPAWHGRELLNDQQIADLAALLATWR